MLRLPRLPLFVFKLSRSSLACAFAFILRTPLSISALQTAKVVGRVKKKAINTNISSDRSMRPKAAAGKRPNEPRATKEITAA